MSPVKCRVDFQAGLKDTQYWTSIDLQSCTAFLKTQRAAEVWNDISLQMTDLISVYKNAGLIIYVDYLSSHYKPWREIPIFAI
jgi:hypothetical protein